ncbi:MAG: class I SAM-dependent methyltransferase [Bacteroidetes bacterium]|nr:class I SAM-dependent methyltransferase [Bacteroidota bacterium]
MVEEEYYKMALGEGNHWWYRSLHQLVLRSIGKYFTEKDISILDAGCGTCGLITFLKANGYENISGFDSSKTAVQICQSKGIQVRQGDLQRISSHFKSQEADIIISNDVLYFFDEQEQRKITDDIHEVLKSGGLLICNMPSISAFRGMHDVRVGIKKRFQKKDLWTAFDQNKYELVQETYWPFFLSPFIWTKRISQRVRMRFNMPVKMESDIKPEYGLLNSALYLTTKLENNLFSRKPFGSSLFLVFKKKI